MQVHPQVRRTLAMIEALRRRRKPGKLEIVFGPGGIERAWVDGQPVQEVFHVEQMPSKIGIDRNLTTH